MSAFCLWLLVECIIALSGLVLYIIVKNIYYKKDTKRITAVMKFINRHKKSNDKLKECLEIIEQNRKDNIHG